MNDYDLPASEQPDEDGGDAYGYCGDAFSHWIKREFNLESPRTGNEIIIPAQKQYSIAFEEWISSIRGD